MYVNKIVIVSTFLSATLMLLTACNNSVYSKTDLAPIINSETEDYTQKTDIEESTPEEESHLENLETDEIYFQAYKDFLLNTDIDKGHDFPIWGYFLFDMNFDGIPELGVLHDSGGSIGGYFTFYRFDGKDIIPAVLDENDNPMQISNYTQILADYEHRKLYLLKEMYLLVGNNNGTYGYVREITDKNGVLYCLNVLNLEVNYDLHSEKIYEVQHNCEDEYLSDSLASEYLTTELYSDGVWKKILPEEYLSIKRKLLPKENSYTDIRRTNAYILLCDSVYDLMDENGEFYNRQLTEDELNTLFAKWSML